MHLTPTMIHWKSYSMPSVAREWWVLNSVFIQQFFAYLAVSFRKNNQRVDCAYRTCGMREQHLVMPFSQLQVRVSQSCFHTRRTAELRSHNYLASLTQKVGAFMWPAVSSICPDFLLKVPLKVCSTSVCVPLQVGVGVSTEILSLWMHSISQYQCAPCQCIPVLLSDVF